MSRAGRKIKRGRLGKIRRSGGTVSQIVRKSIRRNRKISRSMVAKLGAGVEQLVLVVKKNSRGRRKISRWAEKVVTAFQNLVGAGSKH